MDLYFLNIKDISQEDIEDIKRNFPLRYFKSQKFKNDEDKLRSIGAGVLLRKCFPTLREEDISYNKYGKPLSKGLYFNISHSGEYVVIIIADNSVGIDIQRIDMNTHELLMKAFTENEQHFCSKNMPLNLYKTWTRKESIIKLLGTGLKTPLLSIETLSFEHDLPINFENKNIYNQTFNFKDYVVSVSSLNKEKINKHF